MSQIGLTISNRKLSDNIFWTVLLPSLIQQHQIDWAADQESNDQSVILSERSVRFWSYQPNPHVSVI